MKFETKLRKALEHDDVQVRYLALANLGFMCIPGSKQQNVVKAEMIKAYNLLKLIGEERRIAK